jgi:hypothetical protein
MQVRLERYPTNTGEEKRVNVMSNYHMRSEKLWDSVMKWESYLTYMVQFCSGLFPQIVKPNQTVPLLLIRLVELEGPCSSFVILHRYLVWGNVVTKSFASAFLSRKEFQKLYELWVVQQECHTRWETAVKQLECFYVGTEVIILFLSY